MMKNKEKSFFIYWILLAVFIVSAGVITKKDRKETELEKVDYQKIEETLEILEELKIK